MRRAFRRTGNLAPMVRSSKGNAPYMAARRATFSQLCLRKSLDRYAERCETFVLVFAIRRPTTRVAQSRFLTLRL